MIRVCFGLSFVCFWKLVVRKVLRVLWNRLLFGCCLLWVLIGYFLIMCMFDL